MRRVGRTRRAVGAVFAALLFAVGVLVPATLAVGPDKAEVALVFDFSASILDDPTTRNQFADALERMADRVGDTQRDLIKGDTSVSIVQFASKAADVPGCSNINLLGSPSSVRTFANCLRSVAAAYRAGPNRALTQRIGDDTNYVSAMEQAAGHLPPDAVRPTMILFSDGKHDVAGVPASAVGPARDRLFGDRTPFALLPVGMGIDPGERGALEAGLQRLQIIKDVPACTDGATFDWPNVVFDNAEDAGNAVAVALQNATCTFTAAPVAPSPSPNADVRGIRVTPLDGAIEVTWSAPAQVTDPIVDYRIRCAAPGEEPVESAEGESTERKTIVEGLTNGTEYQCEVAAVSESAEGEWIPADNSATPLGRPAAPAKPTVTALDGAVQISVPTDGETGATNYLIECSSDNGTTWSGNVATPAGEGAVAAEIGGLANGVAYICRAFAANNSGTSDASALSDAITPCGGLLECNGLSTPVVAGLAGLLAAAILLGVYFLLRGRGGGYTVAIVDVRHTANLGGGSSVGFRFERDAERRVTGIVPAKGSKAEVRVRRHGRDKFEVRDRYGTHVGLAGQPIVIVDAGTRHELVLQSFEGKAASAPARR